MRHIKLFESFNQEDYYIEVNSSEFNSSEFEVVHDPDFFNSKELDILKSISNRKTMWSSLGDTKGWQLVPLSQCFGFFTKDDGSGYYVGVEHPIFSLLIEKGKDEYFWVRLSFGSIISNFHYYKCDQFEGLIQLLKNKGIIPKENKWGI